MKLSTNQMRTNDTSIIEILTLHPSEIQLLRAIRNHLRFGEVTIKVRDGLPVKMVRIQEFVDLGEKPLDGK